MSILGTGTDIIECLRIEQMLERHGDLFKTRVYTEFEIEYCDSHKGAVLHFAGRWAAKEAVLKAIGTGWRKGIGWRDVEVRNITGGAPIIILRDGALAVFEKMGAKTMHISISHCRNYATATAICES